MPVELSTRWTGQAVLLSLVLILGLLLPLAASVPARAGESSQLSGTVTGEGIPLPNAWVTLTPVTRTGEATGPTLRVLTDGSGRFEFPDVADRYAKVQVRAPAYSGLVDTYFPEAFTFDQAATLTLTGSSIIADVALPPGGSVTGRVTDLDTGSPVPGARVTARMVRTPAAGSVGTLQPVDEPGAFSISGLPPVELRLEVLPPPGGNYLFGSYPRQGVRIDGRRHTSGASVRLRLGAEIRGTVRDDAGTPVPGAAIMVTGCRFDCPLMTHSDATGAYRITGVPPRPGLGVVAWQGDNLLRQWFPEAADPSGAADLSATRGEVLDPVDFSLVRGAFLTVRVLTADTGEPLPEAIVMMTPAAPPSRRFVARNYPSGLGRRVGPLPPGAYTLRIIPSVTTAYRPVEQVVDERLAPRGVIELDPADDVELVARLLPAGPARVGDEPVTPPSGSPAPEVRWPGLAPGFLADPPWPAASIALGSGPRVGATG